MALMRVNKAGAGAISTATLLNTIASTGGSYTLLQDYPMIEAISGTAGGVGTFSYTGSGTKIYDAPNTVAGQSNYSTVIYTGVKAGDVISCDIGCVILGFNA